MHCNKCGKNVDQLGRFGFTECCLELPCNSAKYEEYIIYGMKIRTCCFGTARRKADEEARLESMAEASQCEEKLLFIQFEKRKLDPVLRELVYSLDAMMEPLEEKTGRLTLLESLELRELSQRKLEAEKAYYGRH